MENRKKNECRLFAIPVSVLTMSKYNRVIQKMYGVATISRLLKIIGLFCRIQFLLQGSFAKETYNFREATNRSHPIDKVKTVTCDKNEKK